jgi:hypothetical protein
LTILNVCFAAWVFRGTAMSAGPRGESSMPAHTAMASHEAMASPLPGHSTMAGAMPTESAMAGHAAVGGHGMGAAAMMNQPILVSHVIVGGLLHLAMSAFAGMAFAVVLAVLIRFGLRALATPVGYVAAAAAGGALLYVIMLYGFARCGTPRSWTLLRGCRSSSATCCSAPWWTDGCTGRSDTSARTCACRSTGPGSVVLPSRGDLLMVQQVRADRGGRVVLAAA